MKYGSVKAVKQLAALMAAQKMVPTEGFTRYTGIVDDGWWRGKGNSG